MTRQYWMKLWIEMLDDETVGMLPDHLWRRWVELLLIAKMHGDDGSLPELSRIAWHLRVDVSQLVTEMLELASHDLVEEVGGNWRIPKFADRQAPKDSAERQRIRRKWRDVLGPDVTPESRGVTQKTEEQNTDSTERKRVPAHPAVVVFREETQRYPKKILQPEIENAVGHEEGQLDLWRRVVHEWVALGWNPVNVRGMLDCFGRREIPSNRKNGKQEPRGFAAIRQAAARLEESEHGE